jgi:hypothetical protein
MKCTESKFRQVCKEHVLKDSDFKFIMKVRHPNLVVVQCSDYFTLMENIKKDTQFLADNNIMDYSMLLSIEDK